MTDSKQNTLQRLAELFEAAYPDPAPPKEWRSDIWLYEQLTDAELDHLRHELTDGEVTP